MIFPIPTQFCKWLSISLTVFFHLISVFVWESFPIWFVVHSAFTDLVRGFKHRHFSSVSFYFNWTFIKRSDRSLSLLLWKDSFDFGFFSIRSADWFHNTSSQQQQICQFLISLTCSPLAIWSGFILVCHHLSANKQTPGNKAVEVHQWKFCVFFQT